MTTRQYRLAQPTQLDNYFDSISPSIHQHNGISIDLRAQQYFNNPPFTNISDKKVSTNLPSKQRVNSTVYMTQPVTTNSIFEQPYTIKTKKKQKSNQYCCRSPSLKRKRHSSSRDHYSSSTCDSSCDCCYCCWSINQTQPSGSEHNEDGSCCLSCDCCNDDGCCDCGSPECSCCDCSNCGSCDCSCCDCNDCGSCDCNCCDCSDCGSCDVGDCDCSGCFC